MFSKIKKRLDASPPSYCRADDRFWFWQSNSLKQKSRSTINRWR
jgi:hypothetical protein